jgi:membrane-associated phospholipid phosphatase
MPYRKFLFSFLSLLFILYSSVLPAQDSLHFQNSLPHDSIVIGDHSSVPAKMLQGKIVDFALPPNKLKIKNLIIPGAFLIYGGLKPVINGIPKLDDKIMNNIQENYPGFHTTAADYLMWTPSASVYVMDAFKVRTQHTFKEHLILDAGSILVTGGLGFGMRKISEKINAYNSENTKFPSGHTANAFRGAEIVHQELKFSHPVLSYSGYVVAAGVGLLRIYDKDHFLSEVLAGAGLGILSTKLTYWIFEKVKEKKY